MIKKYRVLLPVVVIIIPLLLYLFCPEPALKNYVPYSRAYYDRDGQLLRITLSKDERYRLYTPLENISPAFIKATILYEDQDFYSHGGVDPVALLRAAWMTWVAGDRRVGASTITMQLARLRWQIKSGTLSGKCYQIVRAIQLSRHYSKQAILEAYLNLAPYGRNIEGVGAASRIYFNKSPDQLSLPEALTLAVIPQNPNKRNPTRKQGYRHLLPARNLLFERWLLQYPEDRGAAKFMDLDLVIRAPEQLPFHAPHFIDFVSNQLSEWDAGHVTTTLSSVNQKHLESIISQYVAANKAMGITNAAALLLNHENMSIEAMVGSSDFFNDEISGQVNGITAKRSPGSTLKPFVYALAMDQGLIHPLSLMKDLPVRFGGFTPENYDKRFFGPLSVKDALIQSRNVPAVNVQKQLTGTSFYQLLKSAGITDLKEESHYGLSLALGGGEVTALELAGLYAALANAGEWQPPRYLLKDAHTTRKKRLLGKEASFLTLDMLKHNPSTHNLMMGTQTATKNDTPWKTGTSWAFRDAWAVGVSGPYVLVVWVGNFDGRGNSAFVGRTAAGPLFFRIMDALFPPEGWTVDDLFADVHLNLKRLDVCSRTGDLFEPHCPVTEKSWFIPGVSPIRLSNIYREIPVNPETGLRACFHQPGMTALKVYEFWPSEFLQVFAMAGISLKSPPPFEASCGMDVTSTSGTRPVIQSPQSSVDYVYRFDHDEPLTIPLTASVDGGVKQLHWFIDATYIGSSAPSSPMTWDALPGEYTVRVVDEDGRSEAKKFRVISVH